jgi:hypothetical protein
MAHWRHMTEEDWPRIKELHLRQQESIGYSYSLPEPSKALLATVEERAGDVRGVVIFERIAEVMSVSDDPKFMLRAMANNKAFDFFLKGRGFHQVQAMVPMNLVDQNEKLLEAKGFYKVGSDLAQFVRLL